MPDPIQIRMGGYGPASTGFSRALKSIGDRMDPPLRVPPAMGTALEKKWLGKKSGTGFYTHSKKKGVQPKLNTELAHEDFRIRVSRVE